MPSTSRPSNAYRDDTQSSKVLRYLVRHYHHNEEVIATYSGDLVDAWELAIHTARRYQGVIYAEYADGEHYDFVRSYAKRSDEEAAPRDSRQSPSEDRGGAGVGA